MQETYKRKTSILVDTILENIEHRDSENNLLYTEQITRPVYETRLVDCTKEELIDDLRFLRNSECFPIINRGKLWYDNLTKDQLLELEAWYKAWLDVTVTLQEPTKPEWLI